MFYFLEKVVDRFRGRKPDNVYERYLERQREYYKHLNDDSWKEKNKKLDWLWDIPYAGFNYLARLKNEIIGYYRRQHQDRQNASPD